MKSNTASLSASTTLSFVFSLLCVMRRASSSFACSILCASLVLASVGAPSSHDQSTQPQPFPIRAGSVIQSSYGLGCDQPLLKRATSAAKPARPCVSVGVPWTPASSSAVNMIAPTARVEFQFLLRLNDPDNSAISYNYEVLVSAIDSAGNVLSASGAATLYGSKAKNVPVNGIKASHGYAVAMLNVPLNVDAAVNAVSFTYSVSQTDIPQHAGPFTLAVTPIAEIQFPALPVAIVYGPLGNQGTSNLQMSSLVGSNLQFSGTNTISNSTSMDNKVTLSAGLTLGDLGFTGDTSWDNSVEHDYTSSYGTSDSITSNLTLNRTYTIPPTLPPGDSTVPSIGSSTFGFSAEPFWSDTFLLATNAQYALWDYPSSTNSSGQQVPILQPLGSAAIIPVNVWALDQCASDVPNRSPLQQKYLEGTVQKTLILQTADCAALLQLDPFYVAHSQYLSTVPATFKFVASGSASVSTQLSASGVNSSTTGNSASSGFTTKVSSVRANTLGTNISPSFPLKNLFTLGITAAFSNDNTTTEEGSVDVNYQSMDSSTIELTNTATTQIQDSCFSTTGGCSTPFAAYLDVTFFGLAIIDSNMNFPPPVVNINPHRPIQLTTTERLPVLCPTCSSTTLQSSPGKPLRYIRDTGYGYVVITEATPAQQAAAIATLRQEYAKAAKRHVKKPVPKPASAWVKPVTVAQEAQIEKQFTTY